MRSTHGNPEPQQPLARDEHEAFLNLNEQKKQNEANLSPEERQQHWENRVRSEKDYLKALDLAVRYKNQPNKFKQALYWLIKAFIFKPEGAEPIEKQFDIDTFLAGYTCLDCPIIFSPQGKVLLAYLIENKTIKTIKAAPYFLTENFSTFLEKTRTLEVLDLSISCDEAGFASNNFCGESFQQLQLSDIKFLVKALKANTSISVLNFANQPVGDEGVKRLTQLLRVNNQLKLSTLNLENCGLTDSKTTIELLKTCPAIKELNISGNFKANGLASETIIQLLRACPKLMKLNLSNIQLGDDTLKSLANELIRNNYILSDLTLDKTGLTERSHKIVTILLIKYPKLNLSLKNNHEGLLSFERSITNLATSTHRTIHLSQKNSNAFFQPSQPLTSGTTSNNLSPTYK